MDNTLIHADIFFFVTTIVVVLVGLALVIALIYLIQILRRIRDVARQLHEEAVLIRSDIKDLRSAVRHDGINIQSAFSFLKKFITKRTTKKSK